MLLLSSSSSSFSSCRLELTKLSSRATVSFTLLLLVALRMDADGHQRRTFLGGTAREDVSKTLLYLSTINYNINMDIMNHLIPGPPAVFGLNPPQNIKESENRSEPAAEVHEHTSCPLLHHPPSSSIIPPSSGGFETTPTRLSADVRSTTLHNQQ